MGLPLWESLKEAIPAYTGLSPATFFTLVALAIAVYYAVSGFFESPPPPRAREPVEEMEPLPPPVQLGEVTEEELKVYDGSDAKKPLLMAIKGQIYDVSQSRMFYGPGGPYALFTGKDASRALAKMSFEEKDLTGDISGLGPFELEALQDWEYKFMSKYVKVGTVKKTVPVMSAPAAEFSETEPRTTEASPTEVAPTEVAPTEVAPTEVAPTEVAPTEDTATPAESVSAETTAEHSHAKEDKQIDTEEAPKE